MYRATGTSCFLRISILRAAENVTEAIWRFWCKKIQEEKKIPLTLSVTKRSPYKVLSYFLKILYGDFLLSRVSFGPNPTLSSLKMPYTCKIFYILHLHFVLHFVGTALFDLRDRVTHMRASQDFLTKVQPIVGNPVSRAFTWHIIVSILSNIWVKTRGHQ